MKKERKETLKVQPLYSIIICFIISVCGGIMLFVPAILTWEKNGLLTQTIYYTVSIMFIVLGIISALRFMEYAVIIGNKIIIKNPFGEIASFTNDEIKSIEIENLITYASRGCISLQWIVIKTDGSTLRKSRLNKKNNGFFQIVASPKNKSILMRYTDNYHIPFIK